MSEKTKSEEFEAEEDEDEDAVVEDAEDLDIEHLMDDIDKRKGATSKPGEPAWRRLERYREERHTAELLSDFDDYDIASTADADDQQEEVAMEPRRKGQMR